MRQWFIRFLVLMVLLLPACTAQNPLEEDVPQDASSSAANLDAPDRNDLYYQSNLPEELLEPISFVSVQAGDGTASGITADGALYGWGQSNFGALGMVVTSDSDSQTIPLICYPVKIALPRPVRQAFLDSPSICLALDAEGDVYGWGTTWFDHDNGGDGRQSTPSPHKVDLPEKAVKLYDGRGAIGIAQGESGAIYLWGWNYQGLLGNGTTEETWQPQRLELPAKAVDVSCHNLHVIALCEDGKVYTWGRNDSGELGYTLNHPYAEGYQSESKLGLLPQEVSLGERVVDVAAGRGTSYAVTESGVVYTWGDNSVGQLGNESAAVAFRTEPKAVSLPQPITAIHASEYYAIAQGQDGTLYGWGFNRRADFNDVPMLDPNTSEKIMWSPVKIAQFEEISEVSVGISTIFVHTTDGKIYGWGYNHHNLIAANYPEVILSPVEISFQTLKNTADDS